MTQQVINVGTTANDGQGDPLREAFIKCNDNFTELYNTGGYAGIANGTSNIFINESSNITMAVSGLANVVVISAADMTMQGNISGDYLNAVADVAAGGFFLGNGRQLTGIEYSGSALTGNNLANNIIFSNLTTVGTLTDLNVAGNTFSPTIITSNIRSDDSAVVTVNDGLLIDGPLSVVGTVYAQNIVGNVIIDNIESVTGNVTAGNLLTAGRVSAGGNVTGGNVITAGQMSATGTITGGNLSTAGVVSATGNINGNYFIGNGSQLSGVTAVAVGTLASLSVTGNINSGNLSTTGTVSSSGNITGSYIIGDGSQLTNITAAAVGTLLSLSVTGNIDSGNLNAGNIAGNYIFGNGSQLTGIVATGVGTLSSLSVTGNTDSGNLRTAGQVSATGNVTGAYIIGNGSQLTNITAAAVGTLSSLSVTGNINGGNTNIAGIVDATSLVGNVISSNVTISSNGKLRGDFSAPITGGRVLIQTIALGNASATFPTVVPGVNYAGSGFASGYTLLASSSNVGNTQGGLFALSPTQLQISSTRTGSVVSYVPITFYTSNIQQVTIETSGNVGMGNANPQDRLAVEGNAYVNGNVVLTSVKTVPTNFDSLPSAASIGAGARAFITDGNTVTFYSTVGNGGSNGVPVFSDGTDWRVG